MSQLTKSSIVESFVRLSARVPVDKITVKDIVDNCGINRNTFYYYFQDMYALIEELFISGPTAESAEEYSGSWLEGFMKIARFSQHNKKLVKNVYISLGRDEFDGYIAEVVGASLSRWIMGKAEEYGCDKGDAEYVTAFYLEALCGVLANWVRHDMKEDPAKTAEYLRSLFESGIIQALRANSGKFAK